MNTPRNVLAQRAAPFVPPLLLAGALFLWAVDTLNWDEWLIWTAALAKLRAGTLSLADLILQNNEQRSAIVRVAGLAFFSAFRLARWPELALIFLMAAGNVLLCWRLMLRSGWNAADRRPLALFSALGFSLMQWETFSVGINTSVILPALTIWAGACIATGGRRLTSARLAALALAGIPASFSFANGLFYWPCMAPLAALRIWRESQSPRAAALATGAWLGFGALVWLGYFHGYVKPAHHPSILKALASPHLLLGYFCTYLGGALAGERALQPLALLAGAFALAALGTIKLALWRTRGADGGRALHAAAPWLCVAAFSLLTAAATAAARGGFGLGQAQESRYATFSTPLWMALGALWLLHGRKLDDKIRRLSAIGFALCGVLFAVSSVLGGIVLHDRAPRLERARQQLYRQTDPDALREIFPDPAFVMAQTPLFVSLRAGPWRFLPNPDAETLGEQVPGETRLTPCAALDGRVPGYVFSGRAPGCAGAWLVVRRTLPEGLAEEGDDIALGKVEADGSFALFLTETALPRGLQKLIPAVLAPDGRTLRPIAGADTAAKGGEAGLLVDNPGRAATRFDLEGHFFVPGLTRGTAPAASSTL
jgi:hypothetical protein